MHDDFFQKEKYEEYFFQPEFVNFKKYNSSKSLQADAQSIFLIGAVICHSIEVRLK